MFFKFLVDLINDDVNCLVLQVIDKVQEETKNRAGIVQLYFRCSFLHPSLILDFLHLPYWMAALFHRKQGLNDKNFLL